MNENALVNALINKLPEIYKNVKNRYNLAAFIVFIIFLSVIIFSDKSLIKILGLLGISVMLVFITPFWKQYLDYLNSKNWTNSTHRWMEKQDPTKSPAYVASVGIERQEGQKMAYKHVLKEIEELQPSKKPSKLDILEERVKGALRSINGR